LPDFTRIRAADFLPPAFAEQASPSAELEQDSGRR
jgi:hypothetical protein